ncbi:MAG: hypothetical protein K2X27_28665 [Candidatus Obscuribacterales bacterium]|nr:hypothetical protein [Candidatus Obscuribacterales bacterium]
MPTPHPHPAPAPRPVPAPKPAPKGTAKGYYNHHPVSKQPLIIWDLRFPFPASAIPPAFRNNKNGTPQSNQAQAKRPATMTVPQFNWLPPFLINSLVPQLKVESGDRDND